MLLTAALLSPAVFGGLQLRRQIGIGGGAIDVDVDERHAVAVDERAARLHEPAVGLDRDGELCARRAAASPS